MRDLECVAKRSVEPQTLDHKLTPSFLVIILHGDPQTEQG
jgi:hypothetical protein